MNKKFNIIYGKDGRVSGTKEVPAEEPVRQTPPRPRMKPHKPSVQTPPRDQVEFKDKAPKPPGQNRAFQVAEKCKELGIKNHAEIFKMVEQAYAGSGKSVSYVENAFNRCLQHMRGEI